MWIPIWNCNQQNSLHMIIKSHKKKIVVKYLKRGKSLKPQINLEKNKLLNEISIKQPIKNFSNQSILFHDKIVHFAPKNSSNDVRISVEFTIISK